MGVSRAFTTFPQSLSLHDDKHQGPAPALWLTEQAAGKGPRGETQRSPRSGVPGLLRHTAVSAVGGAAEGQHQPAEPMSKIQPRTCRERGVRSPKGLAPNPAPRGRRAAPQPCASPGCASSGGTGGSGAQPQPPRCQSLAALLYFQEPTLRGSRRQSPPGRHFPGFMEGPFAKERPLVQLRPAGGSVGCRRSWFSGQRSESRGIKRD